MERIEEFNDTPWYAKDPEILVPSEDTDPADVQRSTEGTRRGD
jgi:hypothetical protein